jgi:hypothetical protein
MTTDVTGFITSDCAVVRVLLSGGSCTPPDASVLAQPLRIREAVVTYRAVRTLPGSLQWHQTGHAAIAVHERLGDHSSGLPNSEDSCDDQFR